MKENENPSEKLTESLKSMEKEDKLYIFMHDWPDLDTMASALSLKKIAQKKAGLDSVIYYCGKPEFIMNRIAMQVLNLNPIMTNLFTLENPKEEIIKIKYAALVDVPSESNLYYVNEIKDKIIIDVDHHKDGKEIQSYENQKFIYYTPSGACTSLFVNWMKDLELGLDPKEDTPLILISWLGIKKDTHDFSVNELTMEDKKAKKYLESLIIKEYQDILNTIEEPSIPPNWYKTLGDVLCEFKKENQELFYHSLGLIDDNALIPFLADEILRTNYAKTVIIYGLVQESIGDQTFNLGIKASGRSFDTALDLNNIFSRVFSKKGRDEKETGGGKKGFGRKIAIAGAFLHLEEYKDLDEEDLKKVYEIWDNKIKKNIKKEFPSSKTEEKT